MANPIEEMLRKTGEFKEKDIKESAKFVKGFANAAMEMTFALPSYKELNEMMGLRSTK